ncbi:VOC family protein [Williamsia muralis]|uniref:VOC family protein n=1 Tax=Williamsia marianensis TaxID=85044 RepID=UPI001670955B|nr:VOC family protein [Williamsia marianensis]
MVGITLIVVIMTSLNAGPRQLWHVGLLVERLEDGMDDLSTALGLQWAPIHEVDSDMERPDGSTFPLKTRVVFSTDLPLAIELIEPSPGTPNVRRGDSAFHHLGYWSDDLVSEEQRLDELGMPCVYFRNDEAGLRRIMLNEGPYGILLEACNALTKRPGLEAYYPGAS